MAAVSQPGSRAGLITALVIFVVLFMVAATFWVVSMNEAKEKDKRLTELQKKYADVVHPSELPTVDGELAEMRNQPGAKGRTFYDLARQQREDLTKLIVGQPAAAPAAIKSAADAVAKINAELVQKARVTVPANSPLSTVITVLSSAVLDRQRQVDDMTAQVTSLNQQLQAKDTARVQETAVHTGKVGEAKAEAGKAVMLLDTYRKERDGSLTKLEEEMKATIDAKSRKIDELTAALNTKTDEAGQKGADLEKLVKKLAKLRPGNTSGPAMRTADGKIIQLSRGNVVYINLGQGQQLSPGMTFQVYDRTEGIPPMTEDDEQLPTGKGAIEVINVGPGSSECRIIKTEPGQRIAEGDTIANLVYDPNIHWSFKVHGKFDLDQNGVATLEETDIAKRLVVQWGGKLTEQVNMDTDYVILGKEPTVPDYTEEQLNDNPLMRKEKADAQKALDEYESTKRAAVQLGIPVLNQNRFLYMIGFFDQARK